MSQGKSLKVIKNALSEVFAKSIFFLAEDADSFCSYTEHTQEAEKNMIQMLQKLSSHFGEELLKVALKEPLTIKHLPYNVESTEPQSACIYPLAQCVYWFCAPKALHSKQRCAPFVLQLLNSQEALMQQSDLFVLKSNPYPNGVHLFDKKRFSAWDLGIIAADYFFIKQALPLTNSVLDEHLCAFDFYHALPDPMYWELQVQLKAQAEQELLDAAISENETSGTLGKKEAPKQEASGESEGKRRRKSL